MEKFKKFLKEFFNAFMSGVYVWFTMFLPAIGIALYVEYGLWWVAIIFVTIDFILIETYGRHYFRLNKHMYKDNTKLKIHHYVEDNDVWVESNDTIDSVIDVEIVRHETLEYKEIAEENIEYEDMIIECYDCHTVINFHEDDIVNGHYVICPRCGKHLVIEEYVRKN